MRWVFSAAYGFKVVGAVVPSVTNEASPSAQQMADLIKTIKSSGAPAIFLDISENQKLAKPDRRGKRSEGGDRPVRGDALGGGRTGTDLY